MRHRPNRYLLVLGGAAAITTTAWLFQGAPSAAPQVSIPAGPISASEPAEDHPVKLATPNPAAVRRAGRNFAAAEKLLARLKSPLAREKAKPNEALLTFRSPEALERFAARAAAAGMRILGRNDRLRTLRVGYDSLPALAADLEQYAGDYLEVDANYSVYPPDVPEMEPRVVGRLLPIGNHLLEFLGVTGDTSKWGTGMTIAVLDSGVVADATFGTGRLQFLDAGYGLAPTVENGHGTAVASLAAGMESDAIGIAPGANLLSIRVTGADGLGDSFTLSQAILMAVDAGAQIVNISMGSYANSYVMANAIDYATLRGVVIVASAGNDQASELTWPAADPRVMSVGAVDAAEQQVVFSNSGDELKLTAPGYGLQTAWVNGQRVFIDGTSGSAPVVSGAIAALMWQNPGLTAVQAVSLLQRYASDGGPMGPDRSFGNGIVNLGWVMNRNNFSRVDTAVSSQFFDPTSFQMQFVVQNRSAQAVSGMELRLNAAGNDFSYAIPALGPGGTFPVRVPVDYLTLQSFGRMDYRTQLVNPPGIIDALPGNNQRTNVISLVQPR